MNYTEEKLLQTTKESICILKGHEHDIGSFKTEYLQECETHVFTSQCTRCGKYITYAIKDSDLNYEYPIEKGFEFNERKAE